MQSNAVVLAQLFVLWMVSACGGGDDNPIVQAACVDINVPAGEAILAACIEYNAPKSSMDKMQEYCFSPDVDGSWSETASCPTENLIGSCDAIMGGHEANKMKVFFYPEFSAQSAENICNTQYEGTWTPES